MIYITSLTVLVIIIVGFYNAWIFKLYFSKKIINDVELNRIANDKVHNIGLLVRGGLCCIPILFGILSGSNVWEILFYTLVCFNASWTLYDLIYNLIHGHKWWYSGNKTESNIDNFLNNTDEYYKLALLIGTIILGILIF